VLHHNGYDRGWLALELTAERVRAEMHCLDTVEQLTFRVETKRVFEVRRESDGVLEITETAASV
jgi:hypothetical protein